MTVKEHKITVTTSGSAGSASGSASKSVPQGRLVAVYLDYHASAPATTDVTITNKAPSGGAPPDVTVLTESNNATDAWRYPSVQRHDNTGSAVTGAYDNPIVHGNVIEVSVAQADALSDCVVAYLYIEE